MNRVATSLLGVVFIAGVLYRPPGPAPPGRTTASRAMAAGTGRLAGSGAGISQSGSSSATPDCRDTDGPWTAIGQALESKESAGPSFSATWSTYKFSGPVRTLIITVPDPVHTRLALHFDRAVASIVQAASDGHYDLDRFWLPWKDTPAPAEPDCSFRLQAKGETQRREKEPGLIVFRGSGRDTGMLLVFLVGESPVYGVDKVQFSHAVRYSQDAGARSFCQPSGCRIDIVGPSFSGSVSSMQLAFSNYEGTSVRFSVISPTATDKRSLEKLDAMCHAGEGPCVAFDHALENDELTATAFWKYLVDQRLRPSELGFISESETAYGEEVERGRRSQAKEAANEGATFNLAGLRLRPYHFPRNVSWLREAYAENPQGAASSSSLPGSLPRQLLPFVLNGPEPPQGDAPPDFAKQQTPISEELEMIALAQRLRNDNMHLAVVAATDPLDLIFVMQYLQQTNRGLQFVVFDSDLVFLRAQDEAPPEGLLSVTPYPLLAGNQPHYVFSSRYSAVLYETCSRLLQSPPPLRAEVESGLSQPLWLTIIGRNGYWPIGLLGSPRHSPTQLLNDKTPPYLWLVVWETLNVLSVLYVLFFWLAQFLDYRALENFRLVDTAQGAIWRDLARICLGRSETDRAHRTCVMRRAFYLLTLMATIWLMCMLVVVPAPVYRWSLVTIVLRVAVVLGLTTVFLFGVVVVLAVAQAMQGFQTRGLWRGQGRTLLQVLYWPVAALAAAAGALAFVWWCYQAAHRHDSYGVFFSYRSSHLDSGVSPAVPLLLLLLALAVWAWNQLNRIAAGIRKVSLPVGGVDSSFEILDRKVQGGIENPIYAWPVQALLLGLFFFAWGITRLAQGRLTSIESSQFNSWYIGLLLLVLWLVSDQWLRFCVVWHELNRILDRLEQLSFRGAFSRLPAQFSWSAIWQQGGMRRSHKLMTRSLDSLAALDAAPHPTLPSLSSDLRELREQFAPISKSEAERTCPSHLALMALDCSFRSTAELLATALAREWTSGLSDSLIKVEEASLTEEKRQESFERNRGRILAEEFLALRYASYIRNTCIQMRYMLFFASAGFILSLLSIESYPFAQHRALGSLMVVIFLVFSAGVVVVFAAMAKDAILSRLSSTEAGKLDTEFFVRVISYGALPLFTVIASQFPSVARFLFSWVEPALQAFK